MNSKKLATFFLCLAAACAFGWGQTGHRVIGAIAENHLSRKAEKAVEELLKGESLAMASTWMDEIRSDDAYDHTHDWHWVTIPEGMTYEATDKNPDGDLVEAINRMKIILKSDTASHLRKSEALKYLVHLVGDLQQPLHVGNGKDQGGNAVDVRWFGESSNLHRVWDSEMIESKKLSYSEIKRELERTLNEDQAEKWRCGSTADWAHEAMRYRKQIYNIQNPDRMGYEYMYRNWSLVKQQLQKGGIRLAEVLNEVLG